MILSHKHKFIFFKTKKTASTSIEIALSKICGPKDIITPISPEDEIARKEFANISSQNYNIPLSKYSKRDMVNTVFDRKRKAFYNHITAKEVKSQLPKNIWDSYYKFTVDRSPFDKMVSLYYWRGGDKKYGNIYEFLTNGGLSDFTSYDIYSIDGLVAVDKVFKYENLETFPSELTKILQLKEPFLMPEYRAKSNLRKIKDHKVILDDKSVKLIKTIFAREIELLNYQL